MALTLPRADIFTGVGFADQRFELFERQELSRTADGVTRAKSFGSGIWKAGWTTDRMEFDTALGFEAKLRSLDGSIHRFRAGDLRRPYPKAHADGSFDDTGFLISVNENNKELALGGLPGMLQLSVGDYLAFSYGSSPSFALHQVMEDVQADSGGETEEFEVRPHIRPGIMIDDYGNPAVALKIPKALFAIEPGSISSRIDGGLFSIVSFSAVQIIE